MLAHIVCFLPTNCIHIIFIAFRKIIHQQKWLKQLLEEFDLLNYCAGIDGSVPSDAAVCEVFAQTSASAETVAGISEGLNVFFLLFAGALVFMMQAGFAMLCAGSVRQKNVKNIMLKNLLDACGGALGFYTVGYAFAYGTNDSGGKSFIGSSNFFIRNFSTGPDFIGWFFQFAFAATAATIVAGTVAERCKMAAYLCYSVFLTGFVSTHGTQNSIPNCGITTQLSNKNHIRLLTQSHSIRLSFL